MAGKKPAPSKAKPSKRKPAQTPAPNTNDDAGELTPNDQRFVDEYLIDLNGTRAYLRVFPGVTEGSACTLAARLLGKVRIAEAVASAKAARSRATKITAEEALQHVWGIATADTRELVEHLIGCCRHCWGEGHRYQRTAGEMERDEAALAKSNEELIKAGKPGVQEFDPKGGAGYDKRRAPHPDCPECFGEGVGRTVFKDTRKLSPGAAALYAGVKETKDGIEVKVHSKGEALEKVFKHLGLYEKDNKQRSFLEGVSRETLKAVVERLRG